ncbi:MAG: N-6 DNA methylase [Treponema sp.]|nr:N-6 DNA methylase [Spirochaetales bacterium]MDY6189018.1 N-6 DNA methylase [Treponema sp.]
MNFIPHTKEESLQIIKDLVARFKQNEKSYTSVIYDESNTRTDFIDKFFEALNWDVRNDNGFAERFREVVREDKVVINGQTKAPDYSFRLGGQKIFFVEAKKPSVNIKDDIAPAYQLRRYAYTAKLPLSILTDFEEFAVFDTKIKPNPNDKASAARIQYMRYDQYEENFDYLWNTFSKEAVQTGSFDQYCESGKNKRGTSEIDNELLSTIEKWRLDLAKNIALRNPQLSLRNLNIAVQKIIDRIIFLRIAEDKDMEDLETLKNACNSSDAYNELKKVFENANVKYNSGLFASENWINELIIDSKVLKDIANELYYPSCPYAWVALPVEVLGNIYEKFLGSEINFKNVKNGHTVTVEEKPEIKKAGGVFYTPTYIVKYIVEQTIGKKLADCTPENASSITICDPACGSGSFLVGAFKYLLNWYLDKYTKNKTEENKNLKTGKLISVKNGIELSIQEKKKILTTHIYGVDIDAQAVEVTKLSLYLQMLEGEGKQENSLFRESDMHVLPYLGDNIKCGNSLIGSDFYASQDLSLFEEEAMYKVNAFDWEKEFSQIFKNGGFDCVIGNPPYVNINTMPEYHEYFSKKYSEIHTGYNDLMYYFLYRGINLLNKTGIYGVITSNYFLGNEYAKKLRLFLNSKVTSIINFKNAQIFSEASVHTTLLFAKNENTENEIKIFTYRENKSPQEVILNESYDFSTLTKNELSDTWLIADKSSTSIINKINTNSVFLGDIAEIVKGAETGKNGIFSVPYKIIKDNLIEEEIVRKCIKNSHIHRYHINSVDLFLIYCDNNFSSKKYPNTYKYLEKYKNELSDRRGPKNNEYEWWRLHRPSVKEFHDAPEKIIVPYRAEHNRFAYDDQQFFNDGGDIRAIVMKENCGYLIKYILALLNSTLLDWYFGFIGKTKGNSREYFNKPLALIPIKSATQSQQQELANLATLMMDAVKRQQEAKSDQEKNICKMRVEAIDSQINAKVYALYGLTEDEIAIVEKS